MCITCSLYSDIPFRDYKYDYCVVTLTPTGHLYIDMVESGMGIVAGGNGYGAKTSDEVGKIAAR